MTYQDVIGIAAVVLEIVIFVVALYFRSKGNVIEMVSRLIAYAEETGLPGPDKMALVVDEMYKYLPAPFRGILTKPRLQVIAQAIFDWTRQYALEYLESKKKKEKEKEEPPVEDDGGDDTFVFEHEFVPEIVEADENPNE